MTKTYMMLFYPGSFVSETSSKPVESRAVPKVRPEGAYAIQFYDVEETEVNGETLKGKPKNHSPTYYWGKEFSAEEAIREVGEGSILASNVRGNKFKRLVKTVRGNWQPLDDKDVVI
jgi:hypothetical protein